MTPHRRTPSSALLGPLVLLLAAACAAPSIEAVDPHDAFLAGLAGHVGQAFEGRIVANEPADASDPFSGRRLLMHVRRAMPGHVEIPFLVGEDRSRTWIITRTSDGLRLTHDHRHEDGSEDDLSRYGGETRTDGTARRQEFPADLLSIDLFVTHDLLASATNVWAMEIDPGHMFAYELTRPGRTFRVEFDLTRPVPPPPAPWGS